MNTLKRLSNEIYTYLNGGGEFDYLNFGYRILEIENYS